MLEFARQKLTLISLPFKTVELFSVTSWRQ